jgi:REP element-mobilizing transposase RayT
MNADIFKRRSIRLKGWDYSSSGLYFVTICTQNRECLFGKISRGEMELNESGQIVAQCWKDIPKHFPHAELDEFIVMPNHVHGIIAIPGSVGAYNHTPRQMDRNIHTTHPMDTNNDPPILSIRSPSKTIGSMIRGFKIGCSNCSGKSTDMSIVWQRNYFEHIIRNEAELTHTRQYIRDNPASWLEDNENPKRDHLKI